MQSRTKRHIPSPRCHAAGSGAASAASSRKTGRQEKEAHFFLPFKPFAVILLRKQEKEKMLTEKIQELLKEVAGLKAADAQSLEELRIKYLSRKGIVNELMGEFRTVAAD